MFEITNVKCPKCGKFMEAEDEVLRCTNCTKKPIVKTVDLDALVSLPVYAEYEDKLPNITDDIYTKMFDMSTIIDGVRMFAYVKIDGKRYYLRAT